MDLQKIQDILLGATSQIKAAKSFTDRLEVVYDVLNRSFPEVSYTAALYGPITNLGDLMSRNEIEPLLKAIRLSCESGQHYISSDNEINIALKVIYEIVE